MEENDRAAAFLMSLKTDFERFSETVEPFVRCFRKAILGFGSSCEPVRVPFDRVDREVSVASIERGAWPQLQPRRTRVVEVEPLQPRPVLPSHRRGLFFS